MQKDVPRRRYLPLPGLFRKPLVIGNARFSPERIGYRLGKEAKDGAVTYEKKLLKINPDQSDES
jgi:hypothetical protein